MKKSLLLTVLLMSAITGANAQSRDTDVEVLAQKKADAQKAECKEPSGAIKKVNARLDPKVRVDDDSQPAVYGNPSVLSAGSGGGSFTLRR